MYVYSSKLYICSLVVALNYYMEFNFILVLMKNWFCNKRSSNRIPQNTYTYSIMYIISTSSNLTYHLHWEWPWSLYCHFVQEMVPTTTWSHVIMWDNVCYDNYLHTDNVLGLLCWVGKTSVLWSYIVNEHTLYRDIVS